MIIPKDWLDSNHINILKNKESWKDKFGEASKNRPGRKTTFELDFIIKKQGLKPKFKSFICGGWGGWIRTNECRHQKPMPYHLATPQHYSKKCPHKRTKVLLY